MGVVNFPLAEVAMPSIPLRFAVVVLALAAGPAAAAETGRAVINLGVGQATVLHLSRPAKDVVVGNPAVADVTVENATTLVVFGRKTGGTTLAVLDSRGKVQAQADLVVGAGGPDSVAVTWASGKDVKQQGGQLSSWACGDFTCVRMDDAAAAGGGGAPAGAGAEPGAPAAK